MSRSIIEEEGFTAYRKQGKQSSLLFWGKMAAPKDCVAEELIKGGGEEPPPRASITDLQ